jgi:hypothetical protein
MQDSLTVAVHLPRPQDTALSLAESHIRIGDFVDAHSSESGFYWLAERIVAARCASCLRVNRAVKFMVRRGCLPVMPMLGLSKIRKKVRIAPPRAPHKLGSVIIVFGVASNPPA